MNNLDIKISEKVAAEAGKEISKLKKELEADKNVNIKFLKDTINDIRHTNSLQRILIYILSCVIVVCVAAMSIVSVCMFNGFRSYVQGSTVEYDCRIHADNSAINQGDININSRGKDETEDEVCQQN